MSLLLYTAILLPPAIAFIVSLVFIRFYLSVKKKREILFQSAKVFLNDSVLLADLKKNIISEGSFLKLASLADQQVDDFLKIRLVKELPYVGMLIGEKTIVALKKVFMKELETLFPTVMNQYMDSLQTENGSDIMIRKNVESISKKAINDIFSPLTKMIIRGSVLIGFVIGFFQVVMVLFMK